MYNKQKRSDIDYIDIGNQLNDEISKKRITVANSCLFDPSKAFDEQTTDGQRVIQLLAHKNDRRKYPLLNVKCSNEFMIIDVDNDPGWKSYLTSHRLYHYGVLGPQKDDHVNWKEWFVPQMDQFMVSPDCQTCDETSELMDSYRLKSAYYMVPIMAGCTQLPVGRIGCDMDFHSYECRVCDISKFNNNGYWPSNVVYNGLNGYNTDAVRNYVEVRNNLVYGLCGFTIRDATAYHSLATDNFEQCTNVTHDDIRSDVILPRRKPSLGLGGRFCMCVKSTKDKYKEYDIIVDDITAGFNFNDGKEKSEDKVYYLYQIDFEDGTFRITDDGGTYILMEDIIFDFHAPDGYKNGNLSTYNDNYSWWPTSDDADKYPGAGSLRDPYFLGFYAGVAIEADSIIFDLNGYKMSMSRAFYYQQAFFAIIALTSQPFLPGQGAGFFGASPIAATNTIVRNGEIGLSSHHGIQGYFNKNLLLEDLKINDFKTHGIQLNGFTDVTIKNCDVGPNHFIDLLTPYYAQHRHYLSNFRSVSELPEVESLCWTFYGRGECTTMGTLVTKAQMLLDMAFETIYFNKDWDSIFEEANENNLRMKLKRELWKANSGVLLNTDHQHPQTASLYGLFFNYQGSNVIGWYAGSESVASHGLTLENVKIHDLDHNTFENIAFTTRDSDHQRIVGCLNAPFNAYHVFGKKQVQLISDCNAVDGSIPCEDVQSSVTYAGNVFVDLQIFHMRLIHDGIISWNYCASGAADSKMLVDFAFNNKYFGDTMPLLAASHDPMIHPGKGVIALRLNGVQRALIKNVQIDRIRSATGKGSDIAGNYSFVVTQQLPYLSGFSMNNVNAVSLTFAKDVIFDGLSVNRIYSDTGYVYGVALWFESNVEIVPGSILKISNIEAGQKTYYNDYDWDTGNNLPNKIPEACAIRIYGDDTFMPEVVYENDEQIDISCVTGLMGCITSYNYSMVGDVQPECDSALQSESDSFSDFKFRLFAYSNYYIWIFLLFFGLFLKIVMDGYRTEKNVQSSFQISFMRN